jgi:hypothetical protein
LPVKPKGGAGGSESQSEMTLLQQDVVFNVTLGGVTRP